MKKLGFFLLMFTLLFCSCNNNKEDLYIELPINSIFIPATISIDKSEIDQQQREEIMQLVNNTHVINDISELPSDPIGQDEAFYHINFGEYTLLITYHFKSWTIDTYSNRFYRNTEENSYNWVIRLGTTTNGDDYSDDIQLTRFAILVRKLPVDADVHIWYSVSQIGN